MLRIQVPYDFFDQQRPSQSSTSGDRLFQGLSESQTTALQVPTARFKVKTDKCHTLSKGT